MRATDQTLDLIRGYYGLMDAGRIDECERYFVPDATMRIAHHPEIAGREAIVGIIKAGLTNPLVKSISHELKAAWEEEDQVVVFEVAATYSLADGRSVTVPGVVIAEIEHGRFRSQRIAADLSVVFS